jgi:hypothetical protein
VQLAPFTYNGTAINDGVNYNAHFPAPSVLLPPGGGVTLSERAHFNPLFAYKSRQPRLLELRIILLGTIHSQMDTLKALFDPYDDTLRTLIVKDNADSDKQWYVECTPVNFPELDGTEVTIILSVPDPVWRSNTQFSDSWGITASGDTNVVAIAGNRPTSPIFEVTPTALESTDTRYKRFITVYNRQLKDVGNSNNYAIDITDGGWDTAAIIAQAANKCQIDDVAGITDAATTIPYDTVTGSIPTKGMAMIETEQVSWTGNDGSNLTGVTRGIGGTTAAAHADNTEIKVSKMLANGDDLRVYLDGSEVPRWLDGINGATTKVWITYNFNPLISTIAVAAYKPNLATAIAGAGDVTTIDLDRAAPNDNRMPQSGAVLIDSEIFTYTGIGSGNLSLTGVTRATRNTSAAAHTVSTDIIFIDHELYIRYGDSGADTPVYSDNFKPLLNLNTSTNTSWDWDDFYDVNYPGRPAAWTPTIRALRSGHDPGITYTDNRVTDADIATELGMKIAARLRSGVYYNNNGSAIWAILHPFGTTTISSNGEKYREKSSWPTFASLMRFLNGRYTQIWKEATPGSTQTWTAWNRAAVALGGTYNEIVFRFEGAVAAGTDNFSAMEVSDVTFTLNSSYTPSVTFESEISGTIYFLEATITNNTSGDWIKVAATIETDTTLEIDCENKTITWQADNSKLPGAITWSSVRWDWLDLASGNNTLQFDQTGTSGVTFVTKWRDRNN